jgi:hypothetical protein
VSAPISDVLHARRSRSEIKVGLITRIDTHRAFILGAMFKAWGM